jgi:hypothetical protein
MNDCCLTFTSLAKAYFLRSLTGKSEAHSSSSTSQSAGTTEVPAGNHEAASVRPGAAELSNGDESTRRYVRELNAREHETNPASSEKGAKLYSLAQIAWHPKWHRVGPILGLSALILTILSIPAAFAILRASDHDPVSSWRYSPNVYLGTITAFTSKAISLAALQGAIVT